MRLDLRLQERGGQPRGLPGSRVGEGTGSHLQCLVRLPLAWMFRYVVSFLTQTLWIKNGIVAMKWLREQVIAFSGALYH